MLVRVEPQPLPMQQSSSPSRKKQQDDDSTESCDEGDMLRACKHVSRAVDLNKIRKAVQKCGLAEDCELCKLKPDYHQQESNGDYECDRCLWLCLRCGNQACGRERNQHALEHFEIPHSDCHALCVNTTQWNVWCYMCDNFVNTGGKGRLLDAVDFLHKISNSRGRSNNFNNVPIPLPCPNSMQPIIQAAPLTVSGADPTLPRPRGLLNLGNTCFFNSVVQCLTQTPYLLELLRETSEAGQYFKLPGGKLKQQNNDEDNSEIELEPLEGVLEKWRALTATLAETVADVRGGRAEPCIPKMLLTRLTSRMPQFAGGDQHDAHELLRHLLEAVREEDLRRYQSVILEKLGYNVKTVPSTVEDEKKKMIKFYGQQASEFLLPTEQVFRGVLASTLQCQVCQHTSHRDEFFLDLSLPIIERQLPPALRRKADEIDDNKPSKYQIKKEKKAERKKNKKSKTHRSNTNNNNNGYNNNNNNNNNNLMMRLGLPPSSDDVNMDKSESESDADVEDNVEVAEDVMKGMESGYNSDKNSSPDSNNRGVSPEMGVDDSGVPSPAIGMLSASHGTPDNSPASSETNIDMGSPLVDHNSPEEDANDFFDRPESRLSFVNKNVDLKMDLSKLSLLNNDANATTVTSNQISQDGDRMEDDDEDDDNNVEGACGGLLNDSKEEKMEEDEDQDLWTNRMSARYQCEEGEYSVQSCLNQFTACELLTGSNKVSCEQCTKRHHNSATSSTTSSSSDGAAASGTTSTEKKTIYTDATKQLLIYNPPAVLILHLKRFQVCRYRSTKVSKMVKFPTILDLAPFCSKRSQNLPTFEIGQTRVLYSLYGVVEHSGSMHGGHYVAYVKVRRPLESDSYRWQFLPKNQKKDFESRTSKTGSQSGGEPDMPSGRWYYISDSHVSEVSEAKVLSAQAYLLFYERIM